MATAGLSTISPSRVQRCDTGSRIAAIHTADFFRSVFRYPALPIQIERPQRQRRCACRADLQSRNRDARAVSGPTSMVSPSTLTTNGVGTSPSAFGNSLLPCSASAPIRACVVPRSTPTITRGSMFARTTSGTRRSVPVQWGHSKRPISRVPARGAYLPDRSRRRPIVAQWRSRGCPGFRTGRGSAP